MTSSSIVGDPGRRVRNGFVSVLVIALAFLALGSACGRERPALQAATGDEVHGYVYAEVRGRRIFLPDVTAYLRNVSTNAESRRVTTDFKGFFMVPKQPPGDYVVCVEAPGYVSACPAKLTVGSRMVFLEPIPISPTKGAVSGTVRLTDGTPCGFVDPLFGINFETRVRATDAGGGKTPLPTVRANYAGDYVIPALPSGKFQIQAECEAMSAQQGVAPSGAFDVVNLTLANSRPTIGTIVATSGDQAVRRVAPGTTVVVSVAAKDQDALQYRWNVTSGNVASQDGSSIKWTLPNTKGRHMIYVAALDGRGGVAVGMLDLSTDDPGALFTGTVTGEKDQPVDGATVEVNGQVTRTNAAGQFALLVKEESPRYTVTITREGYQLLSRVFVSAVQGGQYRLVRAQRFVMDPARGGTLVERARTDNRPGAQVLISPGSLQDSSGGAIAGDVSIYISTIDLRDPEGRFPGDYGGRTTSGRQLGLNSLGAVDIQLVDLGGKPVKLAPGQTAVVRIPVDAAQLRLPGMPKEPPATIKIWFYNPRTGVWDEEGTAKLAGQYYEATVAHFSTINADVEFANPACMRVNTNTARIPLPYQLRVSVPAVTPTKVVTGAVADALSVLVLLPPSTQIKVEVLDSANNVIQTATKTPTTGATSAPPYPAYDYASCTSEVSMTFGEPAPGNALDYFGLNTPEEADFYYTRIDPTVAASVGTVSSSGAAVTGSATVFQSFFVPGDIIRAVGPAGPGTISSAGATVTGTGTTFTTFVVGNLIRAGGQIRMVQFVTSNTQLTTDPFDPPLPANTTYESLQARLIGLVGSNTALTTESPFNPALPANTAYEKVGSKPTLAAWQVANGFGSPSAPDVEAIYLNAGDLGLGRWMNQKTKANGDIAYYVSNYGIAPNFGSADLAAHAKLTNNPTNGLLATVAMEFSSHPGGAVADRYTKFYVFDAAGARVNKAALDGNGAKYVPNLCVICHAGAVQTGKADLRGNYNSRFIFFDPESYRYTAFDDPANPGTFPFTRPNQEAEFKAMNTGVRDRTNVSNAIRDLIDGWYGGLALPLATHNSAYVAKGWRLTGTGTPPGTSPVDKSSLYSNVVKPACRACHTTRDDRVSWDTWDDGVLNYSGFKESGSTINYFVCNAQRKMPHAQITYFNFWASTSPHQPAALGTGGLDGWALNAPCPCGGPGEPAC